MNRLWHHILLTCALAVLLTTCQSDTDNDSQTLPPGYRMLTIGLALDIPADSDDGYATRADMPGDPGTYERFELPQWGYVYFVGLDADGKEVGVGQPATLSGDRPVATDNPIALTGWTKMVKNLSVPQTRRDSIYRYSGNIHFIIPEKATQGRLYVAASSVELPGISTIDYATAREEQVLDVAFNIGEDVKENLQNIYSSPYNYCPNDDLEGTLLDGKTYYGTITGLKSSEPKQVNLLLYHVAAKVDIGWNVATEPLQQQFHFTAITAKGLKQQGCLLFRPNQNTAPSDEETTYDLPLMANDVSQQWYGRQYFYTILYREPFDIHLSIERNDDKTYDLTLRKSISEKAVFLPWLRADLRFTTNPDIEEGIELTFDLE